MDRKDDMQKGPDTWAVVWVLAIVGGLMLAIWVGFAPPANGEGGPAPAAGMDMQALTVPHRLDETTLAMLDEINAGADDGLGWSEERINRILEALEKMQEQIALICENINGNPC